jgi:ketosteroid isomerase-like protein
MPQIAASGVAAWQTDAGHDSAGRAKGDVMPWFPDFIAAVELVRLQSRAAAVADPVAQYFRALDKGDTSALEDVWPGDVLVYDPRAGEVHGHRQLHRFVTRNKSWLAEHHTQVETVATTSASGRAVVEVLAHLVDDGRRVAWPVAVVAESRAELAMEFRTYCSQEPVDGRRHERPSILAAGQDKPSDIVGRYHAALDAGDVNGMLDTFAPDGYFQEPVGPPYVHRGADELRSFFATTFGGGISVQPCVVTDDGARCAVEYNVVRWGTRTMPPQAGLAIYERGPDGRLAAVRVYDDVEAPTTTSAQR